MWRILRKSARDLSFCTLSVWIAALRIRRGLGVADKYADNDPDLYIMNTTKT